MSTIGVRELARNASAIINDLDETKEPALITRRGRPIAYMLPVDSAQFEDFVLANASEFVEGMAAADRELAQGRPSRSPTRAIFWTTISPTAEARRA